MKETIKSNDLVYIPTISYKVYRVSSKFGIDDGTNFHRIDERGCKFDPIAGCYSNRPFAFLATPENKEKLEQVYGRLEDIPVDEGLENFCTEINLLLLAQDDLIMSSTTGSNKLAMLASQVKKHKENLIEMFKERGVK